MFSKPCQTSESGYNVCVFPKRHGRKVPAVRVVNFNPVHTSSRETHGQTVSPSPSVSAFAS